MTDITISRILQYVPITALAPDDVIAVITAAGEPRQIKFSDLLAQVIAEAV